MALPHQKESLNLCPQYDKEHSHWVLNLDRRYGRCSNLPPDHSLTDCLELIIWICLVLFIILGLRVSHFITIFYITSVGRLQNFLMIYWVNQFNYQLLGICKSSSGVMVSKLDFKSLVFPVVLVKVQCYMLYTCQTISCV